MAWPCLVIGRPRTLEDLSAKLGVSERTIRRDLAELADADVRVELSRVDARAAARLLEASYTGVPVTRRERYNFSWRVCL